jgi:predicted MFS family arabinose efflux permease
MVFFFLAGNFALMPPAVQRLFGPKQGTLIYGLLFSSFGTASIGGLVVSKILKEKLGWEGTFQIMAGFSLLACAITHFLQPVAFLKSSSL